jgi:hypothetical protein
VISLISGWTQAYVTGNNRLWYLIRQLIHWGAADRPALPPQLPGHRELMSDQQYTGSRALSAGLHTLLAAMQMDIKLIFFGVFLVFCAFLIMPCPPITPP